MNKVFTILLVFLTASVLQAQKEQDVCLDGRLYRYTIKGLEGMLYHWQAENGIVVNKDSLNDTVFIKWNGLGTYKLKVFGEYDGCFTDWREMKVKTHGIPNINLGQSITMCEGERYTFDPRFENVKDIKWNDGSKGLTLTVDSTQKVWTSVIDKNGCRASDTVQVTVRNLPYINLGPDTMLCEDQELVLNSLSAIYDGTIYEWKLPFNNHLIYEPSVLARKGEGEYSVKVTDVFGCESFDTIRIYKCSNVFKRENIAIAFTPNGDSYNDTWEIKGLSDEYPNAIVDVYDRGGRLVFRSSKGYNTPWDGRDKSSGEILPMSSYFYIINLNNKENDKFPGTLNIIR